MLKKWPNYNKILYRKFWRITYTERILEVVTEVEKLEKLKNDQFFEKPSFSFFERNIERYDGFFRLRDFKKNRKKSKWNNRETTDGFTFRKLISKNKILRSWEVEKYLSKKSRIKINKINLFCWKLRAKYTEKSRINWVRNLIWYWTQINSW
jgi:hypothetical protein